MQIGIPRESLAGETRVAATPATVEQLRKLGFEVAIEAGAGLLASFDDAAFEAAGANVVPSVWQADLIFKVNAPTDAEIAQIKDGATLVSFIWPAQNPELVKKLSERNINVMAMDMVPRISRAQSLDALSSMANIGGYRAVVEAAHQFGRFFTGQITAAGKVPPAKVLVIGAGVAGLAAIGTAGSLGAIVRAFDTRLEVAEQIESMGGEFLKLDFGSEDGASSDGYAKVMSDEFIAAEMALFAQQAKEVDIIITTALIPGRPAPKLITKEMVDSMKPGSVIVDLAAATGGNCEYTVPTELFVTPHGVKVIGYTDLPGRLPAQSSQLYGTNLVNLMKLMCKEKDGQVAIDFEDVVQRNMTVIQAGDVTFPPPPHRRLRRTAEAGRQACCREEDRCQALQQEVRVRCPRHRRLRLGGCGGTCRVPVPLHRLHSVLCGRLLRGVERLSLPAYAADVGHQCHFRHYRGRCAAANRARVDPGHRVGLYRRADCQYQHLRWLHRHSAHAEDVP